MGFDKTDTGLHDGEVQSDVEAPASLPVRAGDVAVHDSDSDEEATLRLYVNRLLVAKWICGTVSVSLLMNPPAVKRMRMRSGRFGGSVEYL